MIFERMSLGEAKRTYDYLKRDKAILLKNNANLRDLSFFNMLMNDLQFFTNGFRHDYGFTVLKR